MVLLMRHSDGIIVPTFYVFAVSIPTLKIFHFCNDVKWVHMISELFEIKFFVVYTEISYFMQD